MTKNQASYHKNCEIFIDSLLYISNLHCAVCSISFDRVFGFEGQKTSTNPVCLAENLSMCFTVNNINKFKIPLSAQTQTFWQTRDPLNR